MSKILVMIKPWSIKYTEEVLRELDEHGTRLKTARIEHINLCDIAEHYKIYRQRGYYQDMIRDFVGLPAVLAIYEGDFNKFNSLKDKIREKYAYDIPINPNYQRNALHISVSDEEFLHEADVWKAYLK